MRAGSRSLLRRRIAPIKRSGRAAAACSCSDAISSPELHWSACAGGALDCVSDADNMSRSVAWPWRIDMKRTIAAVGALVLGFSVCAFAQGGTALERRQERRELRQDRREVRRDTRRIRRERTALRRDLRHGSGAAAGHDAKALRQERRERRHDLRQLRRDRRALRHDRRHLRRSCQYAARRTRGRSSSCHGLKRPSCVRRGRTSSITCRQRVPTSDDAATDVSSGVIAPAPAASAPQSSSRRH